MLSFCWLPLSAGHMSVVDFVLEAPKEESVKTFYIPVSKSAPQRQLSLMRLTTEKILSNRVMKSSKDCWKVTRLKVTFRPGKRFLELGNNT